MRSASCLLPVMHEGEGKWKWKVGWFLVFSFMKRKLKGRR